MNKVFLIGNLTRDPERCRDDYEGCRYFDTEKYEREEKTEDKDVSG